MAKAPENAPTRLIYGFHAVSAKLRHAPDSVLEIYLSGDRKDARGKKFIAQAEAAARAAREAEQVRKHSRVATIDEGMVRR